MWIFSLRTIIDLLRGTPPVFLLLAIACLPGRSGLACTTFFLSHGDQRMMAANLDWPTGDGVLVINKRGFNKTAVSDPAKQLNPAVWTSRYGSVTFNLYGIDWPWAGINEAGLACCGLMLRQAEYPAPDQRPSIFMLQWLQYQLDNFGTVREVLDRIAAIRVRPVSRGKGVHYFFGDRSGDAAIVEWIDGRALVYHGGNLPFRAMANDPYAASLVYLNKINGFGGDFPIPEGNLSKDRFVRAADGIGRFSAADSPSAVDFAFGLLDRVAYRSHPKIFTQWRVVFDIMNDRIYYHTRNNSSRREIELKWFDFSCTDPIKMRNINTSDAGTPNGFADYSRERNRAWVETLFEPHPFKPREYETKVDRISRYPDSFSCHGSIWN